MKWTAFLIVAGSALAGCGGGDQTGNGQAGKDGNGAPTTAPADATAFRADGEVREPAVAGILYAKKPQDLVKDVDTLLGSVVAGVPGRVRAIIVPHGPYAQSGLTAAVAYKQLMGQDVKTVIVLAPSHYAVSGFDGAVIPNFKAFRTPLGLIPVSPKAAELAKIPPFKTTAKAEIKRPDWWQQASKQAPAFGQDTLHTWEHTIEAQLPFLQWALRDFKLVPVLVGRSDPGKVADVLFDYVDDKTLLIASSDLSHKLAYDHAKSFDNWILKAVSEMDIELMMSPKQLACGKGPIITVMHIAKRKDWRPYVLRYSNSGDVKGGNKKSVVGFMAAVFVEEGEKIETPLTEKEGKFLLGLARTTLTQMLNNKPMPPIQLASLPSALLRPRACYVTLRNEGELRGRVGSRLAVKPLYAATAQIAAAAARDTRYRDNPVKADELEKIKIEISILTLPKSLYFNKPADLLEKLRPNVDGVILRIPVTVRDQSRVAESLHLPSVWKEVPDPEKFMDQLSRKAGLPANAWRQPAAKVLTFQAEEIKESDG